MYISKVDGKMNKNLMIQRDTVINANTLFHLGENELEEEENKKKIEMISKRQKEYFLSDTPL